MKQLVRKILNLIICLLAQAWTSGCSMSGTWARSSRSRAWWCCWGWRSPPASTTWPSRPGSARRPSGPARSPASGAAAASSSFAFYSVLSFPYKCLSPLHLSPSPLLSFLPWPDKIETFRHRRLKKFKLSVKVRKFWPWISQHKYWKQWKNKVSTNF